MAHNHGSEFQLKIVRKDGTEALSGWYGSQEQAVEAVSALLWNEGVAYWLMERSVLCPSCPTREPEVAEYPVSDTQSARGRPHDSHYLMAVGSRNRYELIEVVTRSRH